MKEMAMINGKKFYIMHYPSPFGMGSNTDAFLVEENDLKEMIEVETRRKKERKDNILNESRYDDYYTGNVEEVIQERLNNCSTYARCNDLVLLDSSDEISVQTIKMDHVIFRLLNQFGYYRDIIVRDATFKRYFVKLSKDIGLLGKGQTYEFIGYNFKGLNMCSYGYNYVHDIIEIMKGNLRRFKALSYITEGYMKEYKENLANMERGLDKDKSNYDYESLVYNKELVDNYSEDNIKGRIFDILIPDLFGCKEEGTESYGKMYRYDEIFDSDYGIRCFLSSLIGPIDKEVDNRDESESENGKINVFYALANVFGYD